MGVSQSVGMYGFRIGVTTPAGTFFDRNGPAGIEVGVDTPGVDISGSYSEAQKVSLQK